MPDPVGPAHPLYTIQYESLLKRALQEDLGRAGDITTTAIIPPEARAQGNIIARADGRVAGIEIALAAFRLLDPRCEGEMFVSDGSDVVSGARLASVQGQARAILSAERTALNMLGRLSGIATATRNAVAAVSGFPARVLCTRKTTPGFRALEKYAVRMGGGYNHRFGLDDAVLIKDNHRMLAGSIAEAVQRVRRVIGHMVKVQVEVETLTQLEEALELGVDAVLLDNMPPGILAQAVVMARGQTITEASGKITPQNVAEIAATGVGLLSIGWITHSAPQLDVALEVESIPQK
ncbi:MAG: carboxylating nicotinate-nucleotide diphosphorylase [Gemmatimonadales bacterium]|nr:carboxylating nicotinate-nucleotide diphosphorylase [Gemmatimonadales bacterium]